MHETQALIRALKACLKQQNITYRDVAKSLNVSEPTVKRLFSQKDFSLSRLESILAMMDMSLADLIELAKDKSHTVSMLLPQQEVELIQNPKLLLVFFMLLHRWTLPEIEDTFQIEKHEMIQLLARLDKLNLISLEPNNRVKLRTARNFSWKKNGPVQKFFEEHVLKHFFNHPFDEPSAKLQFIGGTVSSGEFERIKKLVEDLSLKINEAIQSDLSLPLDKRFAFGVVLAVRPWEMPFFTQLRRQQKQ